MVLDREIKNKRVGNKNKKVLDREIKTKGC